MAPLTDQIEIGYGQRQAGSAWEAGAGAAADALATIRSFGVSAVIVYVSIEHDLSAVLAGVHSVVGEAPTIGTTTAGEIANTSAQGSVVVVVLASPYLTVRYAVGQNVSSNWQAAVDALLASPSLADSLPGDVGRRQWRTREGISQFGMLFSPGNTRAASSMSYEILEAIKARTFGQLPIMGGASADGWRMESNYVLSGLEAHPDSILLAIFETQLQFGIAFTHGFTGTPQVTTVTSIDGHEVITLDGRPAADVLVSLLHLPNRASLEGKHITLTTRQVFGTADSMGQFSINVATYVTPCGGVRFTQPLAVGAKLTLMEADPISVVNAGPEAIRKAMLRGLIQQPALAIVNHCALRLRLFPVIAKAELRAMRELRPSVPVVGFHSFGEAGLADDGTNRHNNAAVSALVLGKGLSHAAQVAFENKLLQRELADQSQSLAVANEALRGEVEQRQRALAALQQLRTELEQRVEERTLELTETNALLQREIVERMAKERAVKEHASFTEALIKSLPGIFYLVSDRGEMLRWNARFEEISGYNAEEMSQRNALDFFVGDEKPLVAARIAATFEHGEASVEAALVSKGGQRIPHYFTGRHLVQEGQHYLLGMGIDVSDLTRAQEELRMAATVFDTAVEAIVITDTNRAIVAVNPAFTQITGFSREESLGRNPRLLASGLHAPDFYQNMWAMIETEGRWQGEIIDRRKNGESFVALSSISAVRNARGEVTHFLGVFFDITERKRAEEKITHLAHHDALTGLPNRVLMEDRLAQAIHGAERKAEVMALMFVDLDNFKNINDSLGHHIGDLVLQAVAQRIQSSVRQMDTVCRLGGDEFLVILGGNINADNAARVAEKILENVGRSYLCGGHELYVTPSVGISLFPQDGTTPADLLRSADAAMYDAKASGRNAYRFFAPSLNVRVSERLALENSLRDGLRRNEFSLHFQPQIDIGSGRVIGVEALARWHHPTLGLVSPGKFIPIAEESGLIIPLGNWILSTACQQLKQWQSRGWTLPCAVNISAVQFHHKDFAASVAEVLAETRIRRGSLELELTEGIVMRHSEENTQRLHDLKALGVLLSIDDFGTGYSSLSYLKRFPIDRLKIDQSFVRDLGTDPIDAEIVKAIIALAHSLELRVVAEGVETQDQLECLRRFGADEYQGYLYCQPLPAQEFENRMRISR